MNEFSWNILTAPEIKSRDLDLALKTAKAAYDSSEGKDASIVDTYARALFDTGEMAKAIEYQKKAVGLSDDERMKKQLEATLSEYQEKVRKADE
jgi:hypothetical protein